MKKNFLEAGKIVNTHGIRGEMSFQLWCDGTDFLKQVKVLYMDDHGVQPIQIQSVRPHKGNALLCLEGVNTLEKAMALKNQVLYVKREDVPVPEDSHFIQDVIGCKVVDIDSGTAYGTVQDVINLGASDIYVITTEKNQEILIPVIPDIVKEIDIASALIQVKPMKGLFADED